MSEWTFITNHGLVLAYIARHPNSTTREIASAIGVTEWTVHRMIADLEREGYIRRERSGRRNVYLVDHNLHLRHETARNVFVGDLLKLLGWRRRKSLSDK